MVKKPNGMKTPIFCFGWFFWGENPLFLETSIWFFGGRIGFVFMFVVNQIPERCSKQSFKFWWSKTSNFELKNDRFFDQPSRVDRLAFSLEPPGAKFFPPRVLAWHFIRILDTSAESSSKHPKDQVKRLNRLIKKTPNLIRKYIFWLQFQFIGPWSQCPPFAKMSTLVAGILQFA